MPGKNTGPFLAFSESWFKKHQRGLLFLCNAPLIKYWFRYVLRIHKYDCPIDTKITELAPNHFGYGDKLIFDVKDKKLKRQRTIDFRTHDKFSKRIYFAFKPMWWAFHAWDWLVADRFVPAWSFGFSTLTAYPGSIGTNNPVAGYARNSNETWSTARSASTGDTSSASSTTDNMAYCWYNGNNYIFRHFVGFDTSSIPDAADITGAVISFAGTGTNALNADSSSIDIVAGTPASTSEIVNDDFDQAGSTVFGSLAISSWVATNLTYNPITLDANGRANVSKTGITIYAIRNSRDTSNNQPTGNNRVNAYINDGLATAPDAKLVVTYSADLDVSVYDSVAVAEDINRDLQLNPSVSDTVTVAENISTDNQLNPFVYDAVAVAEDIVGQMDLGGISVFDTVAIAEVITAQMNLGDISVYDEITVTESVTVENTLDITVYDSIEVIDSATSQVDLGDISVYDEVSVTESNEFFFDSWNVSVYDEVSVSEDISAQIDLGDIIVSDAVTLTESIEAQADLGDILVYDNVSVTENIAMEGFLNIDVNDAVSITESVTLLVTARRDGWIVNLRSDQQKYPLSMDQNDTRKMRSFEQDSPKSMDTTDIL